MHPLLIAGIAVASPGHAQADLLDLKGATVTPHLQSTEMRYHREPDRSLGARVQFFLSNAGQSEWRLTPEVPIHSAANLRLNSSPSMSGPGMTSPPHGQTKRS